MTGAYRILGGTSINCAGGATPWGTWLSCEEKGPNGQVWECDPQQAGQGSVRPALGSFNHEAVAHDVGTGSFFLTEDDPSGRLYKFVPSTPGSLAAGQLFAASVSGTSVTWVPTSTSGPDRQAGTTAFNGGEGIFASNGSVFFTTKGDKRVWELVPATNTLTVLHDCNTMPGDLNAVDNVTVHPLSGDVYVAEDGGNMELCTIAKVNGVSQVAAVVRVVGHDSSVVTGPAFSPDGTRLYFSSQRGSDGSTGVTYEVTGPFRTTTGPIAPSTVTLPVADDTYVRNGSYATTSYGWSNVLPLKFESGESYQFLSYVAVDVAARVVDLAPPGRPLEAGVVGHVGLGPDDRRDARRATRLVEVEDPVHVAVVGDAHGGLAVGDRGVDDVADPRRSVEHRVLGVLVQVDERVRHLNGLPRLGTEPDPAPRMTVL